MKNNYVVYHLHSDYSLLDSCTDFKDYINRAVELGQKAICFTEHGNIYNWCTKKAECEKAGLKYLHGCEMYLTKQLEPKVRDNYHTILIAKNYDGVKEINKLVSISNQDDHFYFKPRISFDEFLHTSNNIIKISACLASPLNQLPDGDPMYTEILKHYDYLEIQPHINSDEQKQYNKKLFELSKKYNKPLIAGTDTHSLNQYKAECRSMLQLAKGIEYALEDTFDLTYKSYDELVEMFKEQNCLMANVYLEAIENTNIMADTVEEFELDKSFKYPKVYEDDVKELKARINQMFIEKIKKGIIPLEQKKQFLENLREEVRVFEKIQMCGFMLFMSDLIKWCHDNNIPTGPGRGSCCGSSVAYVLDIIDVNPVQWKTVFSRFANEDRKEIGDIDTDFAPDDRDAVYNHMIETFGERYTDYILAIGTVSDKGCIDEIGRALSRKHPENPLYSLESLKIVKADYEKNPDEARDKYPDIFYYFDGMLNTKISQSMHPCGMVVSPVTLDDNYGEVRREGKKILQIDMDAVHEVSLVKYDILGLANIGIIKDACKYANINYPKSNEINWFDGAVWQDMLKCPQGIFQFEGQFAFQMLCAFKPKNLFDMSLVTAALRPSGASYRDNLMKKQFHKNPSNIIDDMLKDNYGYLCLDENQRICTPNGFIKIKDIEKDDVVYTSKVSNKITAKYNNGKQKIYKLKTKCGTVLCTKNHKFLTQEGYVSLENIMKHIEDYCIGHKFNDCGIISYDKNKMKILGWLLGDGSVTQKSGKSINKVQFTHASLEDCLSFKTAIENAFPDMTVSLKNVKSRVHKTDLYRCNVLNKNRTNGKLGLNSLCLYLKEVGLYDKNSLNKEIPKEIFNADRDSLLNFIGAYTDTDSCITTNPIAIQYKTASKELASGLQEILRCLGFTSIISKNEYKGGNYYAIVVSSGCDYLKNIYNYSNKVRRIFNNIDDIRAIRAPKDGELPVSYITNILNKNHISLKKVQTKLNNTLYNKKYITTATARKISEHFNVKIDAIKDDIRYYRVLDIEETDKINQVYDITVDETHDFVLEGGIITHNCYQEDTIKFLKDICGLSGSDADNIRRAIGRKQKDRLDAAMPSILEGYCKMSDKPREQAEQEAKEFLQVIEDSASYQFGYNHSLAYCMVGYLCAYLRYYYPLEFITSYLNNSDNDDDIVSGYEMAKMYNIKILPPRFRHSLTKYVLDKEANAIYKGVASIKFLNQAASDYLYSLRNNEYKTFTDLLADITQAKDSKGRAYINSRQIEILIKLQFFEEFGHNEKLLNVYNLFTSLYGRKTLMKDKLADLPISFDIVAKNASTETEKQFRDINIMNILYEYESTIPNDNLKFSEQTKFEMEILGYINTTYPEVDKSLCLVKDIDTKFKPKVTLYCLQNGKEIECKIDKSVFAKHPLKKSNLIKAENFVKKPKWIKDGDNFKQSLTETEWFLTQYNIIKEDKIC